MMEVKQNTPMDFNDLMSTKNQTPMDDEEVGMADLDPSKLLKTNEFPRNGLLAGLSNGDSSSAHVNATDDIIDLDDDDVIDLDDAVTPELEDVLLGTTDTELVDKLLTDVETSKGKVKRTESVMETTTTTTTTKTTNSTNEDFEMEKPRDLGEELDALLSKIDDLVETTTKKDKNDDEEKSSEKVKDIVNENKDEDVALESSNTKSQSKDSATDEKIEKEIEKTKEIDKDGMVKEKDLEQEASKTKESKEEEEDDTKGKESKENGATNKKELEEITATENETEEQPENEKVEVEKENGDMDKEVEERKEKNEVVKVQVQEDKEIAENKEVEKENLDLEKENVESEKENVESEKGNVESEKENVDVEKEKNESEKENLESESSKNEEEPPLKRTKTEHEKTEIDETAVEDDAAKEKAIPSNVESEELKENQNQDKDKCRKDENDKLNKEETSNAVSTQLNDETSNGVSSTQTDKVLTDDVDTAKRTESVKAGDVKSLESDKRNKIKMILDDDDDDVIFLAEKSAESNDKGDECAKAADTKESKPELNEENKEKENKNTSVVESDDDDVVLLDDDDDDDDDMNGKAETPKKAADGDDEDKSAKPSNENASEAESSKIAKVSDEKETDKSEAKNEEASSTATEEKEKISTTKETETDAANKIQLEDSDNARDKFVGEGNEAENKKAEKSKTAEEEGGDVDDEANSNCSSSSNLLEETQLASVGQDEPTEEGENENDDEEDGEGEGEGEAEGDGEGEGEGEGEGDGGSEDIGDVELMENIISVGESTKDGDEEAEERTEAMQPPMKRLRLSQESDVSTKEEVLESDATRKSIEKEVQQSEADDDGESKRKEDVVPSTGGKRSRSSVDEDNVVEDGKTDADEIATKKQKTSESLDNEVVEVNKTVEKPIESGTAEESKVEATKKEEKIEDKNDIQPANTDDSKKEEKKPIVVKPEFKVVPSDIPIALYPPPNLDASTSSVSLDFFKRFRKSFDTLTKNDLEELVLQKIVEAIVHKSEFAEMREIIEKQEKIIASHRAKISDLSKQFRDLEMVHSRVIKDIDAKNSQFIMPVKITRAVGLQVYIPNKKGADLPPNVAANSTSTGSSMAASTATSGGLVSPMSATIRNSPMGVTNQVAPLKPPQARTADTSLLATRGPNSALASAAAAAAMSTRRACVQKVTLPRPVDVGSSLNSSMGIAGGSMSGSYRQSSNPSMLASNPPKILNKNANSNAMATNAAQQRNRLAPGGHQLEHQQRQQQQQQLQQQQQQQQQQLARQQAQNNMVRKGPTKSNAFTLSHAQQYRRSDPTPPINANSSSTVDFYVNSLNQVSSGSPSVSITPAKPKEKAVIDLTDEDDVGQSQSQMSQVSQMPRHRLPTANNASNNSNASSSSSSYMNNRSTVPPLTRMPSNSAMSSNKAQQMPSRQLSAMQGQKSPSSGLSSISTPPGTSITRVHIPSANTVNARTKYSHPAPLPATPIQASQPGWKLPPPRPSIRISNLDNGIVISWTMEEAMDRHSDCVSYQIYAYQETPGPPLADSWRHVGDVKAMLLPMAVTLTQFQEGQRYFFAVRAVDQHNRFGPFSYPKTWS